MPNPPDALRVSALCPGPGPACRPHDRRDVPPSRRRGGNELQAFEQAWASAGTLQAFLRTAHLPCLRPWRNAGARDRRTLAAYGRRQSTRTTPVAAARERIAVAAATGANRRACPFQGRPDRGSPPRLLDAQRQYRPRRSLLTIPRSPGCFTRPASSLTSSLLPAR
jgi:hypothetical protein